MGEKFLKVYSLSEVLDEVILKFEIPIKTQKLPIRYAVGFFAYEDIYSKIPLPPFKKSLVDGYAVRSHEVKGASADNPVFLKFKGEIEIGTKPANLEEPNATMYVPTGGVVPDDTDSVVMLENTELVNDTLFVYKTVSQFENIFNVGAELKENTLILEKGERITPLNVGLISTTGNNEVLVLLPVKIGIFSTGSEITDEIPLPFGKIYDFNNIALENLLIKDGFSVTNYGIVEDSEIKIRKTLEQALKDNDVVFMTGGTSKGKFDFTVNILNELGNPGVFIHGINVSPGKPTIFASINGKLVVGFSGNPFATFMIYSSVVKDILYKKLGLKIKRNVVYGKLLKSVNSRKGREEFVLGKIKLKDNQTFIEPILIDSSFSFLLKESDGFFAIPKESEGLEEGSIVTFTFWD